MVVEAAASVKVVEAAASVKVAAVKVAAVKVTAGEMVEQEVTVGMAEAAQGKGRPLDRKRWWRHPKHNIAKIMTPVII